KFAAGGGFDDGGSAPTELVSLRIAERRGGDQREPVTDDFVEPLALRQHRVGAQRSGQPPGVRDLITSPELRRPGATPSAALTRVPGRRRFCMRGNTVWRIRSPTRPPPVMAAPTDTAINIMAAACSLRSCS